MPTARKDRRSAIKRRLDCSYSRSTSSRTLSLSAGSATAVTSNSWPSISSTVPSVGVWVLFDATPDPSVGGQKGVIEAGGFAVAIAFL